MHANRRHANLFTRRSPLPANHADGGKNPVWNQKFAFNIINDNSVMIEVKDEDVSGDDTIGTCRVDLARTRTYGSDKVQAPVMSKSGKQHGFVQVSDSRFGRLQPSQPCN